MNALSKAAQQPKSLLRQLAWGVLGILAMLQLRLREDRGDVPGWVLVTVMTAAIVTGLWMVAEEQLTQLLTRAIDSVSK